MLTDADAYAFGYVTGELNSDAMDGRCLTLADSLEEREVMKADQVSVLLLGCLDGSMGRPPEHRVEVDALRSAVNE